MLRDCEKMVLIPSTSTNEWSQIDEKKLMMASNGRDIEKPVQDSQQQQQQQHQQQQLNCPRCDSANTKFCYYNNYSLSQPRHFCKACKRYWTRGGTLRNVPVGGGCRKNKRIKRPSANSSTNDHIAPNSISVTTITNPSPQNNIHGATHNIDLSSTITSNHLTPLFYGLTNGSSDLLNVPFSRLFNCRVSSTTDEGQVYSVVADNIPGLMDRRTGLGYSSSGVLMGESYEPRFNSCKQIQDAATTSSSSLLLSYPMFGSSPSTSNSTSTMASLIASGFQQQKFISNSNNFHSMALYEESQTSGNKNNVEGGNGIMLKEEKTEGGDGQNRLNWNNLSNHQSQIHEKIISSNDPSIPWNGGWFDPSNMGSNSVPSLI